jgi:lauroyl/myristoyl acyltransferase
MEISVTSRLGKAWTGLDYGLMLPAIGRLPFRLGQQLARRRGLFNARKGRDWAELAIGQPYIAQRTQHAYSQIWPDMDVGELVKQRYATTSMEELEALWITTGRFLHRTLDLEPVRHLLAQRPAGRGLVVLTAHFDSFILGMLGLGLCGATTHVMTSAVVEDERVPAALQGHFARKYREAGRYLSGGGFWHVETAGRRFHRALQRGEVVVVVADAPAAGADAPGVWVPWFGAERRLAEGALRLARSTRSAMAALLTVGAGSDTQHWLCHGPLDPWALPSEAPYSGETEYQALFGFMERVIRAHPGSWWGAHLLHDCPVRVAAA